MRMFSNHFTLTKRLLGWLMVIGGGMGFVVILSIDLLQPGRPGGVGPVQQIALGGMIAIALVGLTLIPLGDAPA